MSETKIARLEYELEMSRTENETLKSEIDRLTKGFDAERAESKAEIGKERAGRHIALAALSAGVMPEALDDVVARAERDGWTTDEHNNPVLWDAKNDSPVYSSKGFGNLSPEEWAKGLKTTARHYFGNPGENQPQSSSGCGQQASAGIDVSGPNPWVSATWDDMKQVALIRENPEKAKAMAAAAGSRIGALDPRLAPTKPAY